MTVALRTTDTGLEVNDIEGNKAFAARQLHVGNLALQLQELEQMAPVFAQSPHTILQQLVHAAVELCGADSAGISIERVHSTEQRFYQWVATAGQYAEFLNAALPHLELHLAPCPHLVMLSNRKHENALLASLPHDERLIILKQLEAVPIPARTILHQPEQMPSYVHFLTQGVATVVNHMQDGKMTEVNLVGSEGFAESFHLMGSMPLQTN